MYPRRQFTAPTSTASARTIHRQQQNARSAATRAKQFIYISGIQGQQTLERGVAYHYRGHYIYAIPALNPIEPVPFSSKAGIDIVGTVSDSAPRYDLAAPELVPEPMIAALDKSCRNVWNAQEEEKEKVKRNVRHALETEQTVKDEDEVAVKEMPATVKSGLHAIRQTSRPGSRLVSRGDSHVSLPSLSGPNARANMEDAALSRSARFHQRSSANDLASMVTGDEGSKFLNVPDRMSLQLSPSTVTWSHGLDNPPGRPASAFYINLHPLSSQPVSSPSLTDLDPRDTHTNPGAVSPVTLRGLGHASSNKGSYSSLSSLTVPFRQSTAPYTSGYAPPTTFNETTYTPHDRAHFLSDSAPGSRLASIANTPHNSRPVSPTRNPSLRAASSVTQLHRLLAQDRQQHTLSPVQGTTSAADMFGPDTNIQTEPTSPAVSAVDATPLYNRNKPIGTGRPRRASMALNKAYNAVKVESKPSAVRAIKCTLHGEECDGVSVAETWKTDHAQETSGFVEEYPLIIGAGDRVMIDWAQLLKEQQVAMKR